MGFSQGEMIGRVAIAAMRDNVLGSARTIGYAISVLWVSQW